MIVLHINFVIVQIKKILSVLFMSFFVRYNRHTVVPKTSPQPSMLSTSEPVINDVAFSFLLLHFFYLHMYTLLAACLFIFFSF